MTEAVLTTQFEEQDGIKMLRLSGPLDSATYMDFKTLVDTLLHDTGSKLILDCANLTYVNSKGLALLGRYQRTSAQNNGFFGITSLNKRITRTIDLLGMKKLVKLYDTVDEAIEAAHRQA